MHMTISDQPGQRDVQSVSSVDCHIGLLLMVWLSVLTSVPKCVRLGVVRLQHRTFACNAKSKLSSTRS